MTTRVRGGKYLMSRFRVFPPQFESVRGRMNSSEADQPPVTGVSLITLVRRATSALLSQLFKKDRGLTMVSPAPGVRERKGRVTPLYRRRRSLPSYLGKVGSKSLPAELLIKFVRLWSNSVITRWGLACWGSSSHAP